MTLPPRSTRSQSSSKHHDRHTAGAGDLGVAGGQVDGCRRWWAHPPHPSPARPESAGAAVQCPLSRVRARCLRLPGGVRVLHRLPRFLLRRPRCTGRSTLRRIRELRHRVQRPRRHPLLRQCGRFSHHQRAAHRGARAGSRCCTQQGGAPPHLPAGQLLRALRDGERCRRGRVALPIQRRRFRQQPARSPRARSVVADQ